MAERVRAMGGFTLVEMMVAMGILIMGVTSLIGLLTVAVSTRYRAELRSRAVLIAEQVLHHIEETVLAGDDDPDLALSQVVMESVNGFPGMRYTVEFVMDEDYPELVLAQVRVGWRVQGSELEQVFMRLLPREQPFRARVLRLKESR